MKHYRAETLFAYLDGMTPIEAGIGAHVESCPACAAQLEKQRRLLEVLRQPRVWAKPAAINPAVRAFAERVALEDSAASSLCAEILSGPSAWWEQRMRNTDGAITPSVVRRLLECWRDHIGRSPKDALLITTMAVEVAEKLDPADWPRHYVTSVHAQALRDQAYVLWHLSRFTAAREVADRSARLFGSVPASDVERARLSLVQALIVRNLGNGEEAARLCREAADTFLEFGDRQRYLNARMTEGVVLYAIGAVDRALATWSTLSGDRALNDVDEIRLLHNIALCHADLGEPLRAIEPLRRCVAHYEMLEMHSERTRSRAVLGRALLAAGHASEAYPILRQTSQELVELGLLFEFGLISLDAVEALLALHRDHEVAGICREVVARFTAAGLAPQAIAALSYIREAEGAAAPAPLIAAARTSLRHTTREPRRLEANLPVPQNSDSRDRE